MILRTALLSFVFIYFIFPPTTEVQQWLVDRSLGEGGVRCWLYTQSFQTRESQTTAKPVQGRETLL